MNPFAALDVDSSDDEKPVAPVDTKKKQDKKPVTSAPVVATAAAAGDAKNQKPKNVTKPVVAAKPAAESAKGEDPTISAKADTQNPSGKKKGGEPRNVPGKKDFGSVNPHRAEKDLALVKTLSATLALDDGAPIDSFADAGPVVSPEGVVVVFDAPAPEPEKVVRTVEEFEKDRVLFQPEALAGREVEAVTLKVLSKKSSDDDNVKLTAKKNKYQRSSTKVKAEVAFLGGLVNPEEERKTNGDRVGNKEFNMRPGVKVDRPRGDRAPRDGDRAPRDGDRAPREARGPRPDGGRGGRPGPDGGRGGRPGPDGGRGGRPGGGGKGNVDVSDMSAFPSL